MSLQPLTVGFVPLVDCASLVIAQKIGFAAEEGINLVLQKETSWAAIRDKLVWEQIEAAHMLAPMPIALSAGLGGFAVPIDVLLVLSVNGNVVGIRSELAERIGETDLLDARGTGEALLRAATRLRLGVHIPVGDHAGQFLPRHGNEKGRRPRRDY